MMNNLKYYMKTAFSGMLNNRLMSVSSILTVACCLFLFSVFLLFTLNINFIGDQIKSQCEIQAYIDININDSETLNRIYSDVSKVPNVDKATFETKAEAFNNYRERLGGDSLALEGLSGEDFLRNSVKVSLKDLSLSATTSEELKKIDGVADVVNHQDTVDNVISITSYIKNASFIIMLILMVVSLFIISNTIKLSVASRAEEIHIMKFVGATNWFIRWPFIIEGIMIGFIGSIISLIVTFLGYIPLYTSITASFGMVDILSPLSVAGLIISLGIIFGCGMGAIASTFSTTRHLKV